MIDVDDTTTARAPLVFRDDDGEIVPAFVEAVAYAVRHDDAGRVRALVSGLHETDQGALLEALDADLRPRLIGLLGDDFDFAALTEVDDAVREEILDELPTRTVVEGMKDLESDDAVYILEDLDKADQDEILDAMPAMERVALQKSLDYPEGSAGRLMQTDLIAVPPFWTVQTVLDHL
ncbi:MAG: magnesium transporter MgtE N-terminal domain-containing protein, partial [Alsobacter sp.]